MDAQIKKRRLHTVSRYPFMGSDAYGDFSFADPEPLLCYKEAKNRLVKNREGIEVISTTQLYCDGVSPAFLGDEIEVDNVRRPIIMLTPYDGLKPNTGTTVVYL